MRDSIAKPEQMGEIESPNFSPTNPIICWLSTNILKKVVGIPKNYDEFCIKAFEPIRSYKKNNPTKSRPLPHLHTERPLLTSYLWGAPARAQPARSPESFRDSQEIPSKSKSLPVKAQRTENEKTGNGEMNFLSS